MHHGPGLFASIGRSKAPLQPHRAQMSAELGLLAAASGQEFGQHPGRDHAWLKKILLDAMCAEVDPLRHLAAVTGCSEHSIYERAARHCGLAFHPTLPAEFLCGPMPLDWQLGVRCSARGRIFERDILFLAPGFFQLLRLSRHVGRNPSRRASLCVVPPRVLRAAITAHKEDALIEHARHGQLRTWPRASAHLELVLPIRLGFVLALGLLCFSAALAPSALHPVLVLLVAGLLGPAAFIRVLALMRSLRAAPAPEPPSLPDDELPHYSILVPLRDEAHMVPQLAGALRQLDYPALCIKRTKGADHETAMRAHTVRWISQSFPD